MKNKRIVLIEELQYSENNYIIKNIKNLVFYLDEKALGIECNQKCVFHNGDPKGSYFGPLKQLPFWFDPTNYTDEQIVERIKNLLVFL